jgi:hypothetical protein
MRFAGITEAGRAKAYIRIFKDQPLFSTSGAINPPRSETVLSFAGPAWSRLSPASLVDIYLRAVSTEALESNWKMMLGVQTTTFKLDPDALNSLIQEALPHLDPSQGYASARWQDFLVVLVMLRVFIKDSEPYRVAVDHYHALNRADPSLADWYKTFNSQHWS